MLKNSDDNKNPFPVIDVSDLYDDIANNARADALQDKPNVNDNTIPLSIVQARTKLKTIKSNGIEACQNELHKIEHDIDIMEIESDIGSLKHSMIDHIDKMVNTLYSSVNKINCRNHSNEFVRRKRDFETFRTEHNLNYLPERGTNQKKFLNVSTAVWIVILMYIGESIFNAGLFTAELGLIGGLTISLSTSLVNVVMGFLVGRLVISRIYLHPKLVSKIFNAILFTIFIFTICYLNLMIALYRSLKVLENQYVDVNLADAAWPFPHLYQLDFESTLVLMVGIVFALVALLDGFFSDAAFPGYGDKYRVCVKERELAQYSLSSYQKELNKQLSSTQSELKKLVSNAKNSVNSWSKNVNIIQRRFVDYTDWTDQIKSAETIFYDIYVTNHAKNCSSSYLAPEWFKSPVDSIFKDKKLDPEYVFRDASHHFISDNERIELTKSKLEKIDNMYNECNVYFEEQKTAIKTELSTLKDESLCLM
jgi:multisubunit Na+/H+ antiporter MnhB subunit